MQTNSMAGTATLVSFAGVSYFANIPIDAVIGAFAGSLFYALSDTELKRWKQNTFSLMAFVLGVTGQSSLSQSGYINASVAAAIISAISIHALITLTVIAKSDAFKNIITSVIRNFTGAGGKNE